MYTNCAVTAWENMIEVICSSLLQCHHNFSNVSVGCLIITNVDSGGLCQIVSNGHSNTDIEQLIDVFGGSLMLLHRNHRTKQVSSYIIP